MEHKTPNIQQATAIAEKVFADQDAWEDALGKYVRLFSDIEFSSFWFVSLLGTEQDEAEARCKNFKHRNEYAKDLALRVLSTRSSELCDRWQEFFDAANQHGKSVRNKALHNPLMVSVYANAGTGELSARTEMALMRKDSHQYMTFEQLCAHLDELRQLHNQWQALKADTARRAFMETKGGSV